MYVQKLGGEVFPRTWQEYERLVIRSTDDPNVVIGFRPGAWEQFVSEFLRGAEDLDADFETEETPDDL